ncbi:unnamed protein product, partial [Dibothriocephalus latus]
ASHSNSAVFPTRAPSASSALVNSSSSSASSSLLRRLSDTTDGSDHQRTRGALSPYDLAVAGVGQSQKDASKKDATNTAIAAALTGGEGGRGSQFV